MDYREELTMSLSSARKLAAEAIRQARKKYKGDYDKKTVPRDYRIGEWVLVKFPADETGKMRKLSRPWHGPYRVTEQNNPDVTIVKVYRPQDGAIQVHKTRVIPCPAAFPAGYYWYGDRRSSPGRAPRWVDHLLQEETQDAEPHPGASEETNDDPQDQEPPVTSTDETPTSTATALTPPSLPEDEISEQGASGVGQHRRRDGLRQRVTPPERWTRKGGMM